jgi:hypothetical protein
LLDLWCCRACTEEIQTEEIIIYYLILHLLLRNRLFLLGLFLLSLPRTYNRLFLLNFLCLIGVFLDKITNFRLRIVIIPWINKNRPYLLLLKGYRIRNTNKIEYNFQNLPIILHIILRFGKLTQFIHMSLEKTKELFILLHQKFDSI